MGHNKAKSEATTATHNLSNKDKHFADGHSLMRMKSNLGRPRLSPSDVRTLQGLRNVIKRDMQDVTVAKERIHVAMQAAGDLLKSVLGLNETHHGDNPREFQLAMTGRILGCLNFAYMDLHEMTQDRKPKDTDALKEARKERAKRRRHSAVMKAAWAKRKAKAQTQTKGGQA
jgi:hypothetical protein